MFFSKHYLKRGQISVCVEIFKISEYNVCEMVLGHAEYICQNKIDITRTKSSEKSCFQTILIIDITLFLYFIVLRTTRKIFV